MDKEIPIYLLDLNEELQEEIKETWKKQGRKDLLLAVETCCNIQMGTWSPGKDYEPEDVEPTCIFDEEFKEFKNKGYLATVGEPYTKKIFRKLIKLMRNFGWVGDYEL